MNTEWENLTILQRKQLFIKYVENELKKNEEDYQNNIINDLIYIKNNLFLKTLEKDKKFLKQLKNKDIIFKDNNICQIKNIKRNLDNLIYYVNNNSNSQLEIVDYNYRVVKKIEEMNKKEVKS